MHLVFSFSDSLNREHQETCVGKAHVQIKEKGPLLQQAKRKEKKLTFLVGG